jgi:hypothetical protein
MLEFLAGVGAISVMVGVVVAGVRLGAWYLESLNAAEERVQLNRRVTAIELWIEEQRRGAT